MNDLQQQLQSEQREKECLKLEITTKNRQLIQLRNEIEKVKIQQIKFIYDIIIAIVIVTIHGASKINIVQKNF